MNDKQVKKRFAQHIADSDKNYYPTSFLQSRGFTRQKCSKTGMHFWSKTQRDVCGEASFGEGYTFIGNSPATKQLSYAQVWSAFQAHFEALGYKPLLRYPVVARWRNDVYWVGASVYPFQPYVVSGETKPPSNAVVLPQPSLRFNDVDNVGVTGSHYTCFDMLGQLRFETKQDYRPDEYVKDYLSWLTEGMGIPEELLTIHEDVWAGGGTFGPCLEFFCGGLEIGNQVYMQFRPVPNDNDEFLFEELDIKVLDMGQGHERAAWFTTGAATSYETTFPQVLAYLRERTQVSMPNVFSSFMQYADMLNSDEHNVEESWKLVAQKLNMEVDALREQIQPLVDMYVVAEHFRAALVGIADGALPSNTGGGYNMRIIIRRALQIIDERTWDVDVDQIIRLHAEELRSLWPDFIDQVDNVLRIIHSEIEKYAVNKKKTKSVLQNVLVKASGTVKDPVNATVKSGVNSVSNPAWTPSLNDLLELYDSHGITPQVVQAAFAEKGWSIVVPADFYAQLTERQEQVVVHKEKETFSGSSTHIMYYDDYTLTDFDAKVMQVIVHDDGSGLIELDQTAFYPTSGGQEHDTGMLEHTFVDDVIKQGSTVFHHVRDVSGFAVGQQVHGSVDFVRRKQLSQHHTATHIINAASRYVLGEHVNQAGAHKDVDKARLDITHYANLDDEVLRRIEERAQFLIDESIDVEQSQFLREDAESQFSTRIYQGGFVPGRKLRIVRIGDIDAQACGGTHVASTKDVQTLRIIGTSRIQDGIIRLQYVAGDAAKAFAEQDEKMLKELCALLSVDKTRVVHRAAQVFSYWKKARKAAKKKKPLPELSYEDKAVDGSAADILAATAEQLQTQKEYVLKTLQRFLSDIQSFKSSE